MRRHQVAVRLGRAIVLLALAGCTTKDHTELVVTVWSDLDVPAEMDAVRIQVAGRAQTVRRPFALSASPAPGKFQIPVQLALVPAESKDLLIGVTAIGELQGQDIVSQHAVLPFIPGDARELVLYLARSCRNITCVQEVDVTGVLPSGYTCENGACTRPVRVDTMQLPAYASGAVASAPDASATVADGPFLDRASPPDASATVADGLSVDHATADDVARPFDTFSATPGTDSAPADRTISPINTPFTAYPATLDFGLVTLNAPAPKQLLVVTASSTLSDLAVLLSGDSAFAIDPSTTCVATLRPGSTCNVVIAFTPNAKGVKNGSVTVRTGGQDSWAIAVPMTATVRSPAKLVLSPNTPQMISTSVGNTTSPINFGVANTGDEPTGVISATVTGPNAASFAVTNNNCMVLASLANCTVAVVYKPSSTASTPETAILTVTDTGAGASTASVSLSGTATSAASVSISAASSDLGSVLVRSTGPSTVFTVLNTGGAATGPLNVSLSSPEFVITNDICSGASLATATGSCTVSVALMPTTAGAKSAVLTITGAGAGPSAKTITGTGITPAGLATTPAVLDFGSVRVNNLGTPQTVTIKNNGGSATGALSVTKSGNFSVFPMQANTCTAALVPGATCTFTVNFAPTEAGSEVSAYTVTDGTVAATVTMTGTGLSPASLTMTPMSLSPCVGSGATGCVPDTAVGSTATLTFTVAADSISAGIPDSGAISVRMIGTNAADFAVVSSSCAIALLPGASCQIVVAFTPSLMGTRLATLEVTSANGGSAAARLTGNGFGCTLITIPSGASQGSHSLGTTGAVCLYTCDTVTGWNCGNFDGRTVAANGGTAVACEGVNQPELTKKNGYNYWQISAGSKAFASMSWWGSPGGTCDPPAGGF